MSEIFFNPKQMAVSKSKKQEQLTKLENMFKEAEGIAFATFSGVGVEAVQNIRRELRSQGMEYFVAKKTLFSLAAKNTDTCEFASDSLEGACVVITSSTDSVAPAAAIKKMIKDTFDKEAKASLYDYAGAIFEGKFLNKAETAVLASTPSREESLSKIVGMLKSGPQKLHGVLNSGLTKMARVLDQADAFAK